MIENDREEIVFRIQKKIGRVGSLAAFLIAIMNLLAGVTGRGYSFPDLIRNPSIYVLLIIGIMAFITSTKNSRIYRYCHVAIFLIYGLIASIIFELGNVSGVLFGVYGFILGVQYGMFRIHLVIKLVIFILLYGASTVLSAILIQDLKFPSGVPTAILVACFFFMFWTVFAEDINEISQKNNLLKMERNKDKIFVKFGKNISGVIHNLKSVMMSVDGYNDLIKDADEYRIETIMQYQKQASRRMVDMIDSFMVAVKSYQRTEPEKINLNKLVASSVEVLKGNPVLNHRLRIHVELNNPDDIVATPMEIMQLIDNLVTNASEAMEDIQRYDLFIRTGLREGMIFLEIEDQGNGISFCKDCDEKKCMSCKNFSIGKSSKESGSGIGMIYVREVIKELQGDMVVESSPGIGTKIMIYFPHADEKQSYS
jgi:signal transduction histidine kinase